MLVKGRNKGRYDIKLFLFNSLLRNEIAPGNCKNCMDYHNVNKVTVTILKERNINIPLIEQSLLCPLWISLLHLKHHWLPLPVSEISMEENIQYVFFCVSLLPLSIVFVILICVVSCLLLLHFHWCLVFYCMKIRNLFNPLLMNIWVFQIWGSYK